MPEMEVVELDRHHQDFKITPNVQLSEHYHDWIDRIKVSVKGMKRIVRGSGGHSGGGGGHHRNLASSDSNLGDYQTTMVVVSK